jgi:hypothetical protein
MSETKDLPIYNIYDYMSSIFIYSHVKTYLIDPKRQKLEVGFDMVLLIITAICFFITMFKFAVIIIYFSFFQALPALINFFIILCKSKFHINYGSSCYNCYIFIKKTIKRIITYNFSLYPNKFVGAMMIISYLFFTTISLLFYIENYLHADEVEKSEKYMIFFYLHFESILLIQILCSSFYAYINFNEINISIISGLIIFVLLNLILIIGYEIREKIENVEGIFESNEPQLIINILFNFIFLLLNGKCLYNAIVFKKDCK